MISLWEKQSFLTSDYLIIGAGISGLSTAASIKEMDPQTSVTVLERGVLPTGASTKNAGFACFGSLSELLNDIQTLSSDGMVQLVEMRWDGLQKTCQRLGRSAIDIQIKGGYELIRDNTSIIDDISNINHLLHPFFQRDVFKLSDEKIMDFGFGRTTHLIENELEGQLDTGKLISSLWNYCANLGVKIHTGCNVEDIIEEEVGVRANTPTTSFIASKMAVCTNAFTHKLLPKEDLDLAPGRGIVMSIIPSNKLLFEGTFHYEQGYYYFRDYYGKLLYGGGRNIALDEECTTKSGINSTIKKKLIDDLETIILPDQRYKIEMEWSGIMAFGKDKMPIIRKVSDRITLGVRLGGMGVAIGSLVGEEVAEMVFS